MHPELPIPRQGPFGRSAGRFPLALLKPDHRRSLDALDALALVLSLLLAGVIAMGVMNGMWNAVRERTREVGSLRAIGMHRIQVVWMFLLEGLWLGLGSAAAGAVVAGLVAAALNAAQVPLPAAVQLFLLSATLQVQVDWLVMLRPVLLVAVVAALASVPPAFGAARLRPVIAMQRA